MALHGIDVSSHQPGNIGALVTADFSIVKATGGSGYVNPNAGMQRLTFPRRGALYHFAGDGYPWTTPEVEAAHFLKHWVHLAKPGDLPVLDWEPPAPVHDTAWAARWLEIVARATGKTPLLYCNLSVATSYNWAAVQRMGVKLWLAWYLADNRIDGYAPPLSEDDIADRVGNWDVALWQYTQHGYLPGYAGYLDLNIAYEDLWDTNGRDLVPGVKVRIE